MGTMLSCVTPGPMDISSASGIILAMTSAIVGGVSIVVSALLLGKGDGLGPVNLLFYFSPVQVFLSVRLLASIRSSL